MQYFFLSVVIHDFPHVTQIRVKSKISISLIKIEKMEGNLERRAAGAGEMGEVSGFYWD
jgi:hypothetical protein